MVESVDADRSSRRRLVTPARLALIGAALCGAAGAAWACSDESCTPSWSLSALGMDCANRPAIGPGNDTRVNFLLLMRSLKPVSDAGGAYPKPDWDNRDAGHSFMSWQGLRTAFWPQTTATTDQSAASAPAGICEASADGIPAFSAALTAETGIAPADRTALTGLRAKTGCPGVTWDVQLSGATARDYLAYLKAADAFYRNDWAAARTGFAALTGARNGWVAETARYMPIRIGLRAAVAGAVGQYGDFDGLDKVDQTAVAEARTGIAAYLKAYPQGRYAESARGLTRRVLWLASDHAALARIYEGMLRSTPGDSEAAADLAEEVDVRLLNDDAALADIPKAGNTPLLLAIADLRAMRSDDATKPTSFAASDLAAQQAQFAQDGELFTFLQATRAFYAGEAPRGIMAAIPDATHAPAFTPLTYSRQMLRGMALAKAGDPNEAGFWRDVIGKASPLYQRPFAEVGLAVRWQKAQLPMIFAADSPVQDPTIREILLQTVAPPAILRAEGRDATRLQHERDVARFALLYKDLSRGAYGDFSQDAALVPADANSDGSLFSFLGDDPVPVGLFTRGKWSDGFPCPSIGATAATLARAARDRKAMLCLGDFWRLNGFDGFGLFMAPGKTPDTLGSGPDQFPGKPRSRDAIYAAIIADTTAAPDERAYALYRAVMCYAPSGYNGCAGPFLSNDAMDKAQAPKAQRKAWFDQLHAQYPASPWAKRLQYYW